MTRAKWTQKIPGHYELDLGNGVTGEAVNSPRLLWEGKALGRTVGQSFPDVKAAQKAVEASLRRVLGEALVSLGA